MSRFSVVLVLVASFFLSAAQLFAAKSNRDAVGILPVEVAYHPKNDKWLSLFLQEALTEQLRRSKVAFVRSAEVMQLWRKYLELGKKAPTIDDFKSMHLQHLLKLRLQKVLNRFRIEAVWYYYPDGAASLGVTEVLFSEKWADPSVVIQTIFQKVNEAIPVDLGFTYHDESYIYWEGLRAFYQWRMKEKPFPQTAEWKTYKAELENFLTRYPQIALLTYPLMVKLLIAEATSGMPVNLSLLERAQDFAIQGLEMYPNHDELQSLQAQVHYFRNELHQAKSLAVIANSHNPHNAMARVIYGLSIAKPSQLAEHVGQALKYNPFLTGNILTSLPLHYASLFPVLRDLPQVKVGDEADITRYTMLLHQAQEYYGQREWLASIQHAQMALQIQPDVLEPKLVMAKALIGQKDYRLAQEHLERLNTEFLDHEQVLLYLGVAQERLGNYERAAETYQKALFLNSQNPQVMLRLGVVYLRLKEYGEAQSFLEGLTQQYPDYAMGWWNLGLLYWRQKDWLNAQVAWEKTYQLDPKHARVREYLQKLEQKILAKE